MTSRQKLLGIGLAMLVLYLGVAGCNDSTSPPTPPADQAWQQSVDMNSAYGSYTFANESAAFGDDAVASVDLEDTPVGIADPDSARNDSTLVLRVVWGQLHGKPGITTVTDWTGSVSISAGRLGVLRRIAFDGLDHLVVPRPNRQTVEFVSHTGPSIDGLLLVVHEPLGTGGVTFTFDTAAYTHTWELDSLRADGALATVDTLGNGVSITAVTRSTDACPAGFTRGHWFQRAGTGVPPGVAGYFRGLWLSEDGRHVGHIRGHYGVDSTSADVWFGKIINRNGHLIGLARGTWEPSDDPSHPAGHFTGEWFAAQHVLSGTVEGRFIAARSSVPHEVGFFDGRWRSSCAP